MAIIKIIIGKLIESAFIIKWKEKKKNKSNSLNVCFAVLLWWCERWQSKSNSSKWAMNVAREELMMHRNATRIGNLWHAECVRARKKQCATGQKRERQKRALQLQLNTNTWTIALRCVALSLFFLLLYLESNWKTCITYRMANGWHGWNTHIEWARTDFKTNGMCTDEFEYIR